MCGFSLCRFPWTTPSLNKYLFSSPIPNYFGPKGLNTRTKNSFLLVSMHLTAPTDKGTAVKFPTPNFTNVKTEISKLQNESRLHLQQSMTSLHRFSLNSRSLYKFLQRTPKPNFKNIRNSLVALIALQTDGHKARKGRSRRFAVPVRVVWVRNLVSYIKGSKLRVTERECWGKHLSLSGRKWHRGAVNMANGYCVLF